MIQGSREKIIHQIHTASADIFERQRQASSFRLFQKAARFVPAYKDFLKNNGIQPAKIRTAADLDFIPPVTKHNYLKRYPLEQLLWNGGLNTPLVYTSTSGSTGDALYFPRGEELDWRASIFHDLFFRLGYQQNKRQLVIVTFGMGVWIGGVLTYKAFEISARERNYPVSIITPGINKTEIFKALRRLSPHYDRTILAGYPPFLKDVITEAAGDGINLKKLNLRLLFAAESFTETFRDHVCQNAGIKNPTADTCNIYGTAELGAMAMETPGSIWLRQKAVQNPPLYRRLFADIRKTPTLAQFFPPFTNFQQQKNELLLTSDSAIPLVKYAIGDNGGVITFGEAVTALKEYAVDTADLKKNIPYRLPFVYVYERSDFSTTLYGLQIFPEPIKETLLQPRFRNLATGKLTLLTKHTKHHDQYLEINIELQKDKQASKSYRDSLQKHICRRLQATSSEYAELFKHLGKRAMPKLVFWPQNHNLFFKEGIKQRWVLKKP